MQKRYEHKGTFVETKKEKQGSYKRYGQLNEMGSYMGCETWVVIWDEISLARDKKWALTREKGGGNDLRSKLLGKVQIRLKTLQLNIV